MAKLTVERRMEINAIADARGEMWNYGKPDPIIVELLAVIDSAKDAEVERKHFAERLMWMVNPSEYNDHTCLALFKSAQLLYPGAKGRYDTLEELEAAIRREV